MASAERMKRLAGVVLGNDLALEVGAVAAVSGHGPSSSESPPPVNRKPLNLSNLRGALQLNELDDVNREGLGIEVDFSLPAERVVRALNQIIEWRGKPLAIRVDNGPDYVSSTLMTWASTQGIALTYIQPGKPQQNACVERYNRTVRHEWLDLYIFETIEEVQQIATEWLWTYNNERPNMGIGGVTPAMKLKMAA